MTIFEAIRESDFEYEGEERINFVDDQNNAVGYCMQGYCCESYGWFLSDTIPDGSYPKDYSDTSLEGANGIDPTAYRFDVDYFYEFTSTLNEDFDDATNYAVFKLRAEGNPDIYLTLYNLHNGYYSHGFTADVGGMKIEGLL